MDDLHEGILGLFAEAAARSEYLADFGDFRAATEKESGDDLLAPGEWRIRAATRVWMAAQGRTWRDYGPIRAPLTPERVQALRDDERARNKARYLAKKASTVSCQGL